MILFGYWSNINFFLTIPATSYCTFTPSWRFSNLDSYVLLLFVSSPSSSSSGWNFRLRNTANGSLRLTVVPFSWWCPMMIVGAPYVIIYVDNTLIFIIDCHCFYIHYITQCTKSLTLESNLTEPSSKWRLSSVLCCFVSSSSSVMSGKPRHCMLSGNLIISD